jgi:DNA modification methylase
MLADNKYELLHGDCVERISEVPDDSVGFTVFSPPFSQLYIYTDLPEDMGNCESNEEFFSHFGFLIPELYRVTIPGRLCAIHCKDLPRYYGSDGAAALWDFPGQLIAAMESHGWDFHSRVTVWKCPVTERERTNNNGLLHKTVMRDSSQIRMGMADYVLTFRKTPKESMTGPCPIERPEGFDKWIGDKSGDPREFDGHPSKYARKGRNGNTSVELWRRYAEPVWWDIDQTDVLNYEMAKTSKDEKHICPLQLGLIRRCIYLWSAPDDIVLSPFAGIGSEGVVAIEEGRRFIGIELNPSYYQHAQRHLQNAVLASSQSSLFAEVDA